MQAPLETELRPHAWNRRSFTAFLCQGNAETVMTEPLANMWINANLWRKESLRAQTELERARMAAHEAVVDIDKTSRELIEKLKRTRARSVAADNELSIETPAPVEHSLPLASMLNL